MMQLSGALSTTPRRKERAVHPFRWGLDLLKIHDSCGLAQKLAGHAWHDRASAPEGRDAIPFEHVLRVS